MQRLGTGAAAAAGMTSPTSEDQTQCLLGPLAQLNSTDVSSKCKRSRGYTQSKHSAVYSRAELTKNLLVVLVVYESRLLNNPSCCNASSFRKTISTMPQSLLILSLLAHSGCSLFQINPPDFAMISISQSRVCCQTCSPLSSCPGLRWV